MSDALQARNREQQTDGQCDQRPQPDQVAPKTLARRSVALPEGSLIISVLRDGRGFVPTVETVIEPGDQVLLVLDSGLEEQITPFFAPD